MNTLYQAQAACYLLYGRVVRSYGGYWPFLNTERDCLLAFERVLSRPSVEGS